MATVFLNFDDITAEVPGPALIGLLAIGLPAFLLIRRRLAAKRN